MRSPLDVNLHRGRPQRVAQERINAFINDQARVIREISTVEIFNGDPDLARWRLVLDHVVPMFVLPGDKYKLILSGKITYKKGTDIYEQVIRVMSSFTSDDILTPANERIFVTQPKAHSMVLALKNTLSKLDTPVFHLIQKGNYKSIGDPGMRRVWIG